MVMVIVYRNISSYQDIYEIFIDISFWRYRLALNASATLGHVANIFIVDYSNNGFD